jgi:hypothetical protein
MRKPGESGAPTAKAFKDSEKTAAKTLSAKRNPGTERMK